MRYLLKREVGVNPTRSRRCKRGVFAESHWVTGKAAKMMRLKPEDLPIFTYRSTLRAIGVVCGFVNMDCIETTPGFSKTVEAGSFLFDRGL